MVVVAEGVVEVEREVEEENRPRASGAKEDVDDNTLNTNVYDRNFLSKAGSGEAAANMPHIFQRIGLHEGSHTANEQAHVELT